MQIQETADGTFTISGVNQEQLAMLFHPHNHLAFVKALPAKYSKASMEIRSCLSDLGYMGEQTHRVLLMP